MSPQLIDAYAFCPLCGTKAQSKTQGALICANCGHREFNNPITAVAVFLFDDQNRVLLILRAKDPAKGKWAPPGGFLDVGETLEQAAAREVLEETGVVARDLGYLCSYPNDYVYRGLSRPVCDVFFVARADASKLVLEPEEVSAFQWRDLAQIDANELAFESMRRALAVLRSH